ncbi:ubiquitin-conjugating enzyme/RWD-like protein [Fimicolochytrium jonesii]|uniref:ubiquitin-conjugating enzyme/RWD-like protein n=1 Tax=Fimicolochytrium jonesii TaxID=1396493 RepID=UPI0022FE4BAE|nr:ubiquitin-conjugating enzyme/RWD-like protein [Fimicolochytrium jonesii]KAI8825784.1 ubiquitin-conjugating enzyme/RWD-like protein [Fimicolochytrium jonesii]
MSNSSILRIQKELNDIEKSPENQYFLWYDDSNIKHVHALITGPTQTPYALGMFDFVFNIGDNYPQAPPKVTAMTTSNSRVRFNPNIYSTGKVCLSILGTWEAKESGEKWSAAHGILSVLVSIQSLLSEFPYRNEPDHEEEKDEKILDDYNAKLQHETIRVSVCDRLEEALGWKNDNIKVDGTTSISRPFCTCRSTSPFLDVTKRMFLMYKQIYSETAQREMTTKREGTAFVLARFEFGNNSAQGTFQYTALTKRLDKIQEALLKEPEEWMTLSKDWIANETTSASNLRSQFDQIQASHEYDSCLLMELRNDNPFAWDLTAMGLPMTQHDGGMFNIEMRFHDDFPTVQPRIRFTTEMFHPHISPDGIPYYRVERAENIREYLDMLVNLFKRDPSGDPTTHLNMRATKMWFGSKEDRRDYNRNARRCAQRSTDY